MRTPAFLLCLCALTPAWAQEQQPATPNRDVVLRVEEQLAARGYPVTPDGQYDAELRNNVIRYQSEAGLRPTGEVDLATIDSLGIRLRPDESAEVAAIPTEPEVVRQPEVPAQMAQLPPSYGYPLLRDEHMDSPQVPGQAEPVENSAGLTVPSEDFPTIEQLSQGETPPGFPPGYPAQDLY